METRSYKVYKFDELSDESKEAAMEKFREHNLDYEWWSPVYDDARDIGVLMGITIDRIYFTGFCSQGDGACFEGSYSYELGSVKQIREHAPKDGTIYRLAAELSKLQRTRFYRLSASVKHSGHYYHERSTDIRVCIEDGYDDVDVDTDEALSELLRGFMRWIYKRLEETHDYLQSDESIKETIKANQYLFTEDGAID